MDVTRVLINAEKSLARASFTRNIATNLITITGEALANTQKYAKIEKVKVSVVVFPESVSLVIQDYGIGFDKNEPPQGTGRGMAT